MIVIVIGFVSTYTGIGVQQTLMHHLSRYSFFVAIFSFDAQVVLKREQLAPYAKAIVSKLHADGGTGHCAMLAVLIS